MKKKFLALLLAGTCFSLSIFSQSVSINNSGTAPDPTAMLDVSSTNKGFLFPRMSSSERLAIVNPATGLLVYDTDDGQIFHYRGPVHQWQQVGSEHWDRNYTTVFTNYHVAINGTDFVDPSAILDINSSTKGVLFPRMTTAERNAIVNPAIGLIVFDIWLGAFFMYQNGATQWQEIGLATWKKNGNNFYHTTGFVGIGTPNPDTRLHITQGQSVNLTDHGHVMIGNHAVKNMIFDADEIQAREGGLASALVVQRYGEKLQVGQSDLGTQPSTTVFIPDGTDAGLGAANSGYLMTGELGGANIVIDNNEIQGRNNGVASEITFQQSGSRVVIGSATDAGNAKLLITGGSDISLANNASGFLMMGPLTGVNMVFDNNEIQSRNNAAASTLFINNSGGAVQVGAAAVPAGFLLSVDGKIICEELQVKLSADWADYVFAKNYKLMSLEEVDKYIRQHKHLPDIPAAEEIEKNGLPVGDMQKLQMQKIEELTLYMIEMNKQVKEMKKENERLKARIVELEKK